MAGFIKPWNSVLKLFLNFYLFPQQALDKKLISYVIYQIFKLVFNIVTFCLFNPAKNSFLREMLMHILP